MPWGRIDDSLYDHPKVNDLGRFRLPCMGLYLLVLSWSNRYLTDGHIPADQVKRLGGTPRLAVELVRTGLWDKVADGYRVHDFLDFNDSASVVRRRRAEMRELGKRGGLASGEARRLNSVPLPSVPLPIPVLSDASTARAVDKSKKSDA
jgi:hypothetical protein